MARLVDNGEWAPIATELGRRIRQLREDRHLTQEQLANLSGVHRNQIQNIEYSRNNARDENGRSTPGPANPSLHTIWAIARALDVSVVDLMPEGLANGRSKLTRS